MENRDSVKSNKIKLKRWIEFGKIDGGTIWIIDGKCEIPRLCELAVKSIDESYIDIARGYFKALDNLEDQGRFCGRRWTRHIADLVFTISDAKKELKRLKMDKKRNEGGTKDGK